MGRVVSEIWPGKSKGLVEAKMSKSGAQIRSQFFSVSPGRRTCELGRPEIVAVSSIYPSAI